MGNNRDYRLMFRLFAIPLLVDWSRSGPRRGVPLLSLALMLISMWYLVISRAAAGILLHGDTYAYLLDQVAKWGLFGSLLFLLASSLPSNLHLPLYARWLRDLLGEGA